MGALNWVDFTILGIILFSIIISLIRGFVREAISLSTWVIALWVGLSFSGPLATFLQPYITTPTLRAGISFFVLFALALIVGALINFIIYSVVKNSGLSGTDRLLGMVFGIGRGGLVIALLILIAGLTKIPNDPWWDSSVLIPHFKPLALWLKDYFPSNIQFNLS